jgi:hypothetical protein
MQTFCMALYEALDPIPGILDVSPRRLGIISWKPHLVCRLRVHALRVKGGLVAMFRAYAHRLELWER